MNDRASTILTIAAWELRRFVKLRDMVISLLVMLGAMGASYGVQRWQESSAEARRLAVVSDLPLSLGEGFDVALHEPTELPALHEALAAGELDGILVVQAEHAVLHVDKEPAWREPLQAAVSAAVQQQRLQALPVTPAQLAAAFAPVALEVRPLDDDGKAARVMAMATSGVMVLALLLGMSYLFVSITGDKQQRVTEQLFGIVPAQALVDGKLLGVAGAGAVVTAQLVAVALALLLALKWSARAKLWAIFAAVSPATAVLLVAFAALGFAFWFVVWGALFSTIGDPQSSQRSSLMMLPILAASVAFMGLDSPGSAAMRVLSQLPVTSMTVMPVRMVMSSVPAWEVATALALLLGAVLLVRRFAGRLYEAAILHHADEPGLSQMLRWARRRS